MCFWYCRHNYRLNKVDQPMLEAKRLMEARNLLIKVKPLGSMLSTNFTCLFGLLNVPGKMYARRFFQGRVLKLLRFHFIAGDGVVEELPEDLVHLPLELCRIMVKGLHYQLTNSVCLLPSFMHRLEGFLLALQLRHTLPLSPGASPDLVRHIHISKEFVTLVQGEHFFFIFCNL